MKIRYAIATKESGKHGKTALVSFAAKPMWKDFEELRRQNDTPGFWDKQTAKYALNKYGNERSHEIIPYTDLLAQLEQYKKDFPGWQ